MKNHQSLLALTFFCICATAATVVQAQPEQEGSGPRGTASTLLDEILVTARRKADAEALQVVPITVSAFSGEQLEALFTENLFDIGQTLPNVRLGMGQTVPMYANFYIRGTGLNSTVLSSDPTVGIFIDGMYLGVPAGVVTDTFDLESVEVLRGPQGTLFGRNVTGGAVQLRTSRPSHEFGARFRGIVGANERFETSASVTGGLTERTAGKLALFYKDQGPTFNNKAPEEFAPDATDIGDRELLLVRPSLLFDVNDDLSITLLAEIGDGTNSVGARQLVANDEVLVGVVESLGLEVVNDTSVSLNFTPELDSEWHHLIGEVLWSVGDGQLKSITTYRDFEQEIANDLDGAAITVFHLGPETAIEQDQFSQEFVYSTTLSDRYDLTTGLYYFDQSYTYFEQRVFSSGEQFAIGAIDHSTLGVFAQVDIRFANDWTLTLGGRYTEEEKEAVISRRTIDCTAAGFSSCVPGIVDDNDWSNFTPKVGLQWLVNDDSQVYTSYSKGFRSGGFNVRATNDDARYDEEEVDAFEIGYKSEWSDGRVRFNAAYFYNEFSDLQRTVTNPDDGASQSVLNAADASIQGVELEGVVGLIDNFYLSFSLGWLDASFDRFDNLDVTGDGTPDPELARGLDIPRAPKETRSLIASYDIPLSHGLITLRGDYTYTSAVFLDDQNQLEAPQYELYNASIAYTPESGRWRVSLFGRNLTDEFYVDGGFNTGSFDFWDVGPRRTWGIEFNYEI